MGAGFNFKRRQNRMKATVEVQYDEHSGDFFIELPPDILLAANLAVGDTVVWKELGAQAWALKKQDS